MACSYFLVVLSFRNITLFKHGRIVFLFHFHCNLVCHLGPKLEINFYNTSSTDVMERAFTLVRAILILYFRCIDKEADVSEGYILYTDTIEQMYW